MVWLPQLTALAGASVTVVGTYVSGSTQSTATYTTSITGTSGAFTLLNLTPARVKSLCGISSSATLYEYTAKGNHSGTFNGQLEGRGDGFAGMFTNSKGTKYRFHLTESY